MQTWQLQYVKAHLSEVVKLTLKEGPQMISVRGDDTTVMISKKDYDVLIGGKPNLVEFLRRSPLMGEDLKMERDSSLSRDIDL